MYFSSEGCTQGDQLGPFLFAIGYHWQLLEVQAMHPATTMVAMGSPWRTRILVSTIIYVSFIHH